MSLMLLSWHEHGISQRFLPRASERRVLLIVGVCFTFSHLHMFWSSHLHISSSHLRIYTYHLLIFTSTHIILSSSQLRIFAPTHVIFTSSHLLIFRSTHVIFTSSHLHIFTTLTISLSLSHVFSLSSLFRPRAMPTRRHEMQPFRTKWGLICTNCV